MVLLWSCINGISADHLSTVPPTWMHVALKSGDMLWFIARYGTRVPHWSHMGLKWGLYRIPSFSPFRLAFGDGSPVIPYQLSSSSQISIFWSTLCLKALGCTRWFTGTKTRRGWGRKAANLKMGTAPMLQVKQHSWFSTSYPQYLQVYYKATTHFKKCISGTIFLNEPLEMCKIRTRLIMVVY